MDREARGRPFCSAPGTRREQSGLHSVTGEPETVRKTGQVTTENDARPAAGALLTLRIYPRQRDALADPDDGGQLRALSMTAGIYNLLWAIVVVLMIVRPGGAA